MLSQLLFWAALTTVNAGLGQELSDLTARSTESETTQQTRQNSFRFSIASDTRYLTGPNYDTVDYFRGECEAIAALGGGVFMISAGDTDPPWDAFWTIENCLTVSNPDYLWYAGVGNHELDNQDYLAWLRAYNSGGTTLPHVVNLGPPGSGETTYSFDYENVHFVQINEYFDGTLDYGSDGDVVDALYYWLEDDLATNLKPFVFVIGHEPGFPQPDADSGRARHIGGSLDKHPVNRDRFYELMRNEGVTGYICGHTHNYSLFNINGTWQIDSGHSMGADDTDSKSTFLLIDVDQDTISYQTYRRSTIDGAYSLFHSGLLACPHCYSHIFQDGLYPSASYQGTCDTYIDAGPNHGAETSLSINGEPDQALLLRWDISAVPPGSTVLGASLGFQVSELTLQSYAIYALKRAWQEEEADWTMATLSSTWEVPGASGSLDRGLKSLGQLEAKFNSHYLLSFNAAGLQLIQSWINDPVTNQGLIITDYSLSDGSTLHSRETAVPMNRPKLTLFVEESTPAEASPTTAPMTALKGAHSTVELFYMPAACASTHAIYWTEVYGNSGSLPPWTEVECSQGTSGWASFDPGDPPPGNIISFVVVGQNGRFEGSYGQDSSNLQRLEADLASPCNLPQDPIGSCPL